MALDFEMELQKLNRAQREAVESIDGPVLVVAGPGTGKTQLLAMRVANILKQTDTLAQNILCLTFTDSAAQNMRQRLKRIIGLEAQKVAIYTFHGLGTEIINQNQEHFFFGAGYEPADDLARIDIIEKILSELEHDDPLRSFHPEHGWTYRKDIVDRIKDLKQAGLTPLEFREIIDAGRASMEVIDPILTKFLAVPRIDSIKQDQFDKFAVAMKQVIDQEINKTYVGVSEKNEKLTSTNQFLHSSWIQTFEQDWLELTNEMERQTKWITKFLKTWRDRWSEKDDNGDWHLKDWLRSDKHLSLSNIYESYQLEMAGRGLFDFDDMLLSVVEAFRRKPSLRYKYQEKFLYILVDEFQDTNGVQMSLIDNLIDLKVTEGRPNLLAVGDDDQGIYKFQRATIENILNFKQKYKDVKIITLTDNYRSTQDILDLAQLVIEQSETRLADMPEVNKVLKSKVN
jgi:DNA helicase II / ATP-dependent DNA helicase PcrA